MNGSDVNLINLIFIAIPNLGLASEHGFFYKYPKNMRKNENNEESEWKELFHIKDWSWKDSVLNMLQGFTEKTEGSYITKKEAMVSWYYKDCDIYFGHVQANEINTHLQNIYENCKIDIVNGKGYVEIKPKNVNKGYFISHIIKQQFVEKFDPDFILAVGDDISDEEMFKYLNSVHNQLSFFKENIKTFSCTICRKPSSAKYYLNEINEVYEYLESLNQTHHSLKKESNKKSLAKLHKSKQSLNLIEMTNMNNFNI